MAKDTTWVNRRLLQYGSALAVAVVASVCREVMVRNLGGPLPPYITFYPGVMIVSLVFGLRQGLLATLFSLLMTGYWILPREGTGIARLTDVVGMVLFAAICVCMAVMAEVYRRTRDRAAAYERQLALQKSSDALRRSEERYRSLVVATAQVVWTKNSKGEVTTDMPMWRAFTGQTVDQIQGSGWIEALHPDDQKRTAEAWRKALNTNTPYETEYRLRRQDGRYCHMAVRGVPILGEDGEVREWVEMCTDISERKQTEEQLRKASRYTRTLIEASLDPLVTISREGKITDVNRATESVTGVAREELIGSDFSNYFSEPEKARAVYQRVFAEGFVQDYPLAIRDVAGRRTEVLYNATAFRNAQGDEEGVFAAARDVTKQKQAESEAQRYMQELERSNAELQDFASIASHDLQEPLRKVIAFGEHLKEHSGDKLDDLGRDFLARMQNAAQRMSLLIEALLQYSRVATRAQPFQPVDMLAVVFGAVSDMEERISRSQARIEFTPMPKVMADPMQVRQLIQNLVANALKFQRPGTKPHVLIEGRTTDHGDCEITVRDNGIGFEEKYLERIFRPFQRLHGRSEYEGSGMGLAICHKVVARHGGTITARSRPGEGSTFVVTLPAGKTTAGERRELWETEETKPSASESCSPKTMTTIST